MDAEGLECPERVQSGIPFGQPAVHLPRGGVLVGQHSGFRGMLCLRLMSRVLGTVLVLLAFLVPVEASLTSRRVLDGFGAVSALQTSRAHTSRTANSYAVGGQSKRQSVADSVTIIQTTD